MYETKDSSFLIFDTTSLVIAGIVIVLAIAGLLLFQSKKRSNKN